MNRSRWKPLSEFDKAKNTFRWAKRFLLVASLVQLPFFLPLMFSIPLSNRLFFFVLFISAIFGILGFMIVSRQLELNDEALRNSPTQGLIGPVLSSGMVLFFWGAFFVPLLNLIAIVWAYGRARSAIRLLDQFQRDEIAKQARIDHLTGGSSSAF